jgi:hypothetical protein
MSAAIRLKLFVGEPSLKLTILEARAYQEGSQRPFLFGVKLAEIFVTEIDA